VQGINLYDLFARGAIPSTSSMTPPGALSLGNDQNARFLPDTVATCGSSPGTIEASLLADLQTVFTTGKLTAPSCAPATAGGSHANAVGYATIDVVANCNATSPLASGYFANDLLFDNVLTGDYQHVNPNPATGNFAGGSPLVHIRAVPEGGAAGAVVAAKSPFTLYDLYTAGAPPRTRDRRQPLPSAFVTHFIEGGTGAFNTSLQIWREAFTAPTACPLAYKSNSLVEITDEVRFDEHENPTY